MLKNANLLAKIGADTTENETNFAKKLSKTLATTLPLRWSATAASGHRTPRALWLDPSLALWLALWVALPLADASALSKLNRWRLLKLIKIKKARSRLYRSQILQENARWKALAEIYTMHFNLNFFVKNC